MLVPHVRIDAGGIRLFVQNDLFVQGHQALPAFLFSTRRLQRPLESDLGLLARLLRDPVDELLVVVQLLVRVFVVVMVVRGAVVAPVFVLRLALGPVCLGPILAGHVHFDVVLGTAALHVFYETAVHGRAGAGGHAVGAT